ncbi:unnamed protein product [Amoebophrya sp. A25]|nr:unnamed protein product [Amoebophrya sp. A25]|eukprot:GSA25T00019437001.1
MSDYDADSGDEGERNNEQINAFENKFRGGRGSDDSSEDERRPCGPSKPSQEPKKKVAHHAPSGTSSLSGGGSSTGVAPKPSSNNEYKVKSTPGGPGAAATASGTKSKKSATIAVDVEQKKKNASGLDAGEHKNQEHDDDSASSSTSSSSEEDDDKALGTKKKIAADLRSTQHRLQLKERELEALKEDTKEMLLGGSNEGDSSSTVGLDPVSDWKRRLYNMAQRSRRQHVTIEAQKTKIQELEQKLVQSASSGGSGSSGVVLSEEQKMQNNMENQEFRQKFLSTSNQLQETRRELSEVKTLVVKMKKLLLREFGSDERVDAELKNVNKLNNIANLLFSAPGSGGGPSASGSLSGPAQQHASELTRNQLESEVARLRRELTSKREDSLVPPTKQGRGRANSNSSHRDSAGESKTSGGGTSATRNGSTPSSSSSQQRQSTTTASTRGGHQEQDGAADIFDQHADSQYGSGGGGAAGSGAASNAGGRSRRPLEKIAEEKRKLLDSLQKENATLHEELVDSKSRQRANVGRISSLEDQVQKLKHHVSLLVQKSDRDDQLIQELGAGGAGGGSPSKIVKNAGAPAVTSSAVTSTNIKVSGAPRGSSQTRTSGAAGGSLRGGGNGVVGSLQKGGSATGGAAAAQMHLNQKKQVGAGGVATASTASNRRKNPPISSASVPAEGTSGVAPYQQQCGGFGSSPTKLQDANKSKDNAVNAGAGGGATAVAESIAMKNKIFDLEQQLAQQAALIFQMKGDRG